MSLDTTSIETVTFDSFTTIVDVRGSTRRVLSNYVDNPNPIARLWRFRAIDYRMLVNFCGPYETYEETTRDALKYALAVYQEDLSEDAIDEIMSVFYELAVFDDVRSGIESIHEMGYDIHIASNGTDALLEAMIDRAGIEDLVEHTVSADEVEVYKPDNRFYNHVADRVDTDKSAIAHVATPWYDVYGAIHSGMKGVWVNRGGRPWDEYNGTPDSIVTGLDDLASAFAFE